MENRILILNRVVYISLFIALMTHVLLAWASFYVSSKTLGTEKMIAVAFDAVFFFSFSFLSIELQKDSVMKKKPLAVNPLINLDSLCHHCDHENPLRERKASDIEKEIFKVSKILECENCHEIYEKGKREDNITSGRCSI